MRCAILFLISCLSIFAAKKTLDVYFIDVEGGQATLFVSPSGQSMLVDTGWPGMNARDANRIIAAAKKAGVKKIDYVVISHHHADHVGGAKQLAERIPVGMFIDKGPSVETSAQAKELAQMYEEARSKSEHRVVKPGDTIPVKGLDIKVVTADGQMIAAPANAPQNAACSGVQQDKEDTSDNARSLGVIVQYGKFKLADLGDLTWNKELELVCPANRVGTVDVYLTTHHGLAASNTPPIVTALKPRVAIMNNGARKGGMPAAWKIIKAAPGMEDIWQIHFAVAGGTETNAPDTFIANLEESNDQGHYIHLAANQDGSFTVTNSRNKYTKTYPAK
jgi:beta-lactamase superfamily II metal-dependent hydrolase